MFLTLPDLDQAIYPDVAQAISRQNSTVVLARLAYAEAELESYLSKRFAIRTELERTGTARNELLKGLCLDIAAYHLYANPATVPDNRVKRYEQAIRMLTALARGEGDLPGVAPAPVPTTPTGQKIGFGSEPRRPSGW